jgi:hypothetical protein
MFEIISYLGLIGVVGFIVVHFMVFPPAKKGIAELKSFPEFKGQWWCFWSSDLGLLGRLDRLAFLVALICLSALFLTGFGPPLLGGKALTGFLLISHATAAPVFIVCVAFLVFNWAYRCRFDAEDREWLRRLCSCRVFGFLKESGVCCKLAFWFGAILCVPVAMSIIVSMFPIFGTHGLETLFKIHQYGSLLLVLDSMVLLYFVCRASNCCR